VSVPPALDSAAPDGFVVPPATEPPTDPLTELREPALSTPPPPRAQPSLGVAKAIVVPVATPTPKAPNTGHSLRGNASYYCWAGSSPCTSGYADGPGFDAYAAAGPKLRAALGSGWRGRVVSVDGIAVKLIDWCQCYKGQSNEKLLDLYHDVFARTGSSVVIRW
jgi:hypothetical protein